ncbi:hypothetical protein RJT34_08993 [Clitoria ternatea]|uniref:Uncharacterized protein n=1 Tax=Clitoria ternatea TaxID=43366 RepID=A0AAN9K6E7_CLITE
MERESVNCSCPMFWFLSAPVRDEVNFSVSSDQCALTLKYTLNLAWQRLVSLFNHAITDCFSELFTLLTNTCEFHLQHLLYANCIYSLLD